MLTESKQDYETARMITALGAIPATPTGPIRAGSGFRRDQTAAELHFPADGLSPREIPGVYRRARFRAEV